MFKISLQFNRQSNLAAMTYTILESNYNYDFNNIYQDMSDLYEFHLIVRISALVTPTIQYLMCNKLFT